MINKDTIISVYNEKLTLVQWLKTVNKALDEAVLTNVEIAQRGNATFVFVFTFEDGTQVESNEIIVNQGESIVDATIKNGHLLLALSNDDVLDAGNVKPVSSFSFNSSRHLIVYYGDGTNQDLGLITGVSGFSIDANQHLIVSYDNGTTEDLGAIFSGDVNINGKLSIKTNGQITADNSGNISFNHAIAQDQANEVVNITYTMASSLTNAGIVLTPAYSKLIHINGQATFIANFKLKNESNNDVNLKTMGGDHALQGTTASLSTSLASKIFDFNGNDLNNAPRYAVITTSTLSCRVDSTKQAVDVISLLVSTERRMYFDGFLPNITLASGETAYFTIRIEFSLL